MTDFTEMSPTFRLYAMPSLLEGMAMAVDIPGAMTEFNSNESGSLADSLATASDWRAVAEDLRAAFGNTVARVQ